jgi:hypothetical protein
LTAAGPVPYWMEIDNGGLECVLFPSNLVAALFVVETQDEPSYAQRTSLWIRAKKRQPSGFPSIQVLACIWSGKPGITGGRMERRWIDTKKWKRHRCLAVFKERNVMPVSALSFPWMLTVIGGPRLYKTPRPVLSTTL